MRLCARGLGDGNAGSSLPPPKARGAPIRLLSSPLVNGRPPIGTEVGRSLLRGVGGTAALSPRDVRLPLNAKLELGVVVVDCRKEDVGTGRNVGVEGRDVVVATEDNVDMVLPMEERPSVDADMRDCGLRMPLDEAEEAADGAYVLCVGRKVTEEDAMSDGLLARGCSMEEREPPLSAERRELPLSAERREILLGCGVASSMMSTQPGLSAPFNRVRSFSFSVAEAVAECFSLVDAVDSLPESLFRPDTLPIRSRGTRECNFCSSVRTRARISLTICTPLDFVVVEEVELPSVVVRVAVAYTGMLGRGVVRTESRMGKREGDATEGMELERARPLVVGVLACLMNPARCRTAV